MDGKKTFTAGSFHYPPFSLIENGQFIGGVELKIIREIAKRLQRRVILTTPTDGGQWGDIQENGSLTGLIGDIAKGKVDVGFAQVLVKIQNKSNNQSP